MQSKKRTLANKQDGFAALIVAMILILVLSLTTVGFAQLMRREERQALDKQLSSQAYYAAESGINDAAKAISLGYTGTKTECPTNATTIDPGHNQTGPSKAPLLNGTSVGSNTNAEYTCLLINSHPPNVQYSPVDITTPKTAEIEGIDSSGAPRAITTLTVSWQDTVGNNSWAPSCSAFNPAGSAGGASAYSYTGLLRFQLIPVFALDRPSLINNTFTSFFCPGSGDGTIKAANTISYGASEGPTNAGAITTGNCSLSNTGVTLRPYHCNVQITNLSSVNSLYGGESAFVFSMRSIYSPTSVIVQAYGNLNGDGGTAVAANRLDVVGAQTVVDSTGRAQDVLRRLQVRIPREQYDIPDGTHGTTICKQLNLLPGSSDGNDTNCP